MAQSHSEVSDALRGPERSLSRHVDRDESLKLLHFAVGDATCTLATTKAYRHKQKAAGAVLGPLRTLLAGAAAEPPQSRAGARSSPSLQK